METKNLSTRLIQRINASLLEKDIQLEDRIEQQIRLTVQTAFREGYGDCLEDRKKGLIKLPSEI